MLYPHFFEKAKAGPSTYRKFAVLAGVSMLLVGIGSATVIEAGSLLVVPLLGHEYAASVAVCSILALSQPFIAAQYPAADVLTGLGKDLLRAKIALLSTAMFGAVLASVASLAAEEQLPWAFVLGHVCIAILNWIVAAIVLSRMPSDHRS